MSASPMRRAWRRIMRRTMAPRRPPLYMEQWTLALVTAVALLAGVGILVAIVVD